VYFESPAMDALPVLGKAVSAWQALQSRLEERKGLRVLVCFQLHLCRAPRSGSSTCGTPCWRS
jgi:hypothetical protein